MQTYLKRVLFSSILGSPKPPLVGPVNLVDLEHLGDLAGPVTLVHLVDPATLLDLTDRVVLVDQAGPVARLALTGPLYLADPVALVDRADLQVLVYLLALVDPVPLCFRRP